MYNDNFVLPKFILYKSMQLTLILSYLFIYLFLQKELFKSAMEVTDDGEKGDEITTPTDPNVSMSA